MTQAESGALRPAEPPGAGLQLMTALPPSDTQQGRDMLRLAVAAAKGEGMPGLEGLEQYDLARTVDKLRGYSGQPQAMEVFRQRTSEAIQGAPSEEVEGLKAAEKALFDSVSRPAIPAVASAPAASALPSPAPAQSRPALSAEAARERNAMKLGLLHTVYSRIMHDRGDKSAHAPTAAELEAEAADFPAAFARLMKAFNTAKSLDDKSKPDKVSAITRISVKTGVESAAAPDGMKRMSWHHELSELSPEKIAQLKATSDYPKGLELRKVSAQEADSLLARRAQIEQSGRTAEAAIKDAIEAARTASPDNAAAIKAAEESARKANAAQLEEHAKLKKVDALILGIVNVEMCKRIKAEALGELLSELPLDENLTGPKREPSAQPEEKRNAPAPKPIPPAQKASPAPQRLPEPSERIPLRTNVTLRKGDPPGAPKSREEETLETTPITFTDEAPAPVRQAPKHEAPKQGPPKEKPSRGWFNLWGALGAASPERNMLDGTSLKPRAAPDENPSVMDVADMEAWFEKPDLRLLKAQISRLPKMTEATMGHIYEGTLRNALNASKKQRH